MKNDKALFRVDLVPHWDCALIALQLSQGSGFQVQGYQNTHEVDGRRAEGSKFVNL